MDKPKLTVIDGAPPAPETLKEQVKARLRANKLPFPQCPNCHMLDYEINYIAGTKTKVCIHCKMKHQRIVTMR